MARGFTARPILETLRVNGSGRLFSIDMLRRDSSRVPARTAVPRWLVEPSLHELIDQMLQCAADAAGQAVPDIAPWPRRQPWALVLTRDGETRGLDAIEVVRAVDGQGHTLFVILRRDGVVTWAPAAARR